MLKIGSSLRLLSHTSFTKPVKPTSLAAPSVHSLAYSSKSFSTTDNTLYKLKSLDIETNHANIKVATLKKELENFESQNKELFNKFESLKNAIKKAEETQQDLIYTKRRLIEQYCRDEGIYVPYVSKVT